MTEIIIPSIDGIAEAARRFVPQMGIRRVFAFHGGMGAGKTTFIKAICHELGVHDPVTSPTFAIVNEYSSDTGAIFHFDFYRIKNSAEVLDIGFEDYAYSGNICLIEWPELIEDMLPEDTVNVHIAVLENGTRVIHMN